MVENNFNKPVIGIVGGCGPDATIDIQMKLSKVMKAKLNPQKDQDYFGVLINNDTQVGDRTLAIASGDTKLVQSYINRCLQLQEMGADVLLIACNTAHFYYDYIQSNLNVKLLNMIEKVAEYILNNYPEIRKVGLICTLGTLKSRYYHQVLKNYNIEVVECDLTYQTKVHQAIYGIKAGFIDAMDISDWSSKKRLYSIYHGTKADKDLLELVPPQELLVQALNYIDSLGITHTILGCTELPLAIDQSLYNEHVLIDPNYIIASSAVDYCLSIEKEKQDFMKKSINNKRVMGLLNEQL